MITMTAWAKVLLFVQAFVNCVLTGVQSAPITITRDTFNTCQRGDAFGIPADCCPPKTIKGPIVDFCPKKYDSSKPLRVRKALQCLSGKELETYTQKLEKGYEMMRALPDDDPRSLKMQNNIHCAYGTGSFIQDGSTNLTIDIHLNWFFLPWHRLFLYFHERILQMLLKDPEFTLHFWNFDNSGQGPKTSSSRSDGCCKPGHFVPPMYSDPSKATFHSNRSSRALNSSGPVDLSFDFSKYNPATGPPVFPHYETLEEAVNVNNAIMHKSLVTLGNYNASRFIGKEFRAGDPRITVVPGAGSLEWFPHISMHIWVGGSMSIPHTAPSDPIFYPAHANTDRLWTVWHSLSDDHVDPTDRDWLDAEFLLWDENAVLRRGRVRDILHTEDLGYTYEKVNDGSWISVDDTTTSG